MDAFAPPERDPDTGLLNTQGFDRVLDAELSRSARHELPLSLVLLEVVDRSEPAAGERQLAAIVSAVATALCERIRSEDSAARIGRLKFAVLGVETADAGTLAAGLAEHVRRALLGLETEAGFAVTAGGADAHYDELSRQELLRQADRALAAAGMTGGDVAFPSPRRASAASVNGPEREH
jgi:diguanylate cyclase (GGDEF)-like protein